MTTHTDTSTLVSYIAKDYPSIDGGEARFISKQLQNLSTSLTSIIAVMKLMEARMNTNGLT